MRDRSPVFSPVFAPRYRFRLPVVLAAAWLLTAIGGAASSGPGTQAPQPPSAGTQLTTGEVQEAIKAGQGRSLGDLVVTCSTGASLQLPEPERQIVGERPPPSEPRLNNQHVGAYLVEVSASAGRIALSSRDAKQRKQAFGIKDVTADMLAPGLHVSVTPEDPFLAGQTYQVDRNSPAVGTILRARRKGMPDVELRPDRSQQAPITFQKPLPLGLTPTEYSNLSGGKFQGIRSYALFSREAVIALPKGDFDVVVLTAPMNQYCKVTASSRAKLIR